jgi:hypothetical protein
MSTDPSDEFLFIVKSGGVLSTKAVILKGGGLNQVWDIETNLLANVVLTTVDYPACLGTEPPVGWEKSISEARTSPVATNKLFLTANSVPVTDASGNSFTAGLITMPSTGFPAGSIGPY